MNLTALSNRIALATVVVFLAFLLVGCQKQTKFNLEQVPEEYRSCAVEVVPKLKDGPITQKELIVAYAKLKRYALRQNTCYRGLLRWVDAQHSAYYNSGF